VLCFPLAHTANERGQMATDRIFEACFYISPHRSAPERPFHSTRIEWSFPPQEALRLHATALHCVLLCEIHCAVICAILLCSARRVLLACVQEGAWTAVCAPCVFAAPMCDLSLSLSCVISLRMSYVLICLCKDPTHTARGCRYNTVHRTTR
jgi:hypothetical protein